MSDHKQFITKITLAEEMPKFIENTRVNKIDKNKNYRKNIELLKELSELKNGKEAD